MSFYPNIFVEFPVFSLLESQKTADYLDLKPNPIALHF